MNDLLRDDDDDQQYLALTGNVQEEPLAELRKTITEQPVKFRAAASTSVTPIGTK